MRGIERLAAVLERLARLRERPMPEMPTVVLRSWG